jgi:hypothetical protein
MIRPVALAALVALSGCGAALDRVGLLGTDSDAVAVRVLQPRALGRSCRSSVLGLPLGAGGPALSEAIGEILAHDTEGDVVTNAEITWEWIVTGVYNRRCVRVRGDLGHAIPTLTLRAPPSHHGHGGD